MREDTKRRLDRAIWQTRMRAVGLGAAALLVMVAVFWWIDADATDEKVRVGGTISSVGLSASKNVQGGLLVGVTLDDGKQVNVLVNQITDPKVGQKVEITEHRHASGRKNYSWK